MKPQRSITLIIFCCGLVAVFATQPFAGIVAPLCCDLPERQGGQHNTQGSTACYGARDCPTCLHSSDCEISGGPLIGSGVPPETLPRAWKSLTSYSHARGPLPACLSFPSSKIHSEVLADIYPSPDLPIFLLDLTLII